MHDLFTKNNEAA